jgi:hypothetical protein
MEEGACCRTLGKKDIEKLVLVKSRLETMMLVNTETRPSQTASIGACRDHRKVRPGRN